MPYTVTLPDVTRGDSCERAIALTFVGPPVNGKPGPRIPMPATQVAALMAAYPLMEAQFKADGADTTALITLTSTAGGIRIEPAYPLPDGTTGPCLVMKFTPAQTAHVIDECVWDLQFSGPGLGPQTWIRGEKFSVVQDVTRTATDTV